MVEARVGLEEARVDDNLAADAIDACGPDLSREVGDDLAHPRRQWPTRAVRSRVTNFIGTPRLEGGSITTTCPAGGDPA